MNTAKYLAALESSIYKLHQLPDADPVQNFEIVAGLCDVLRLGKVEVVVYENEASEQLGKAMPTCFYDSGKACQNHDVSQRFTTVDEMVIIYHVYPIAGEPEWTEEERNRVRVFIALLSSISGKSRLLQLAHRMTYYDNELDMYNLRQFMKWAHPMCRSGQIKQYAAVRFNLKHFSVVNQYVGRENGTIVMKKFIQMIDDLLDDEQELICRMGGDNFLAAVKKDKLPAVLAILSGTNVVYDEKRGERIFVSATAGVYVIDDQDDVRLPTDVMDRVSLAAQLAKTFSEIDMVYFNEDLLAKSKHNNDISAIFPKALEDREFLVYYQPKVAVNDRHIAGAEALCRWMHDGKLVPPGEFIPVLEQGLDICKLDFYMLDTVCRDIRRWLDQGKKVVRISVNFSRRHLSDIDLLEHIIEVVDRHHVPHEYIEIELTETTTDVEFKDLKRTIRGLQKAGISTSVDDFGIGYSSLNLIKEIPWNVLKLDKTLLPDQGDENLVQKGVMFKYVVAMAQDMGLECIAEGVETEEQVRLLADNGCNLAQGFYFDRPLPVEEFETRFDRRY